MTSEESNGDWDWSRQMGERRICKYFSTPSQIKNSFYALQCEGCPEMDFKLEKILLYLVKSVLLEFRYWLFFLRVAWKLHRYKTVRQCGQEWPNQASVILCLDSLGNINTVSINTIQHSFSFFPLRGRQAAHLFINNLAFISISRRLLWYHLYPKHVRYFLRSTNSCCQSLLF